MRILICGGRDFNAGMWMADCLAPYIPQMTHLITGGCPTGVDEIAFVWGGLIANLDRENNLVFKADWSKYGKAAGPIRNQVMLDAGRPDLVIAFPGGRGTADMIKRAERQDIPVKRYSTVDYNLWKKQQ